MTFVKLSFAFLQYPVTQFYALSSNGQGEKGRGASRELLLALAWLLATQDVLATSVNEKISNSILSQEFSSHKLPKVSLLILYLNKFPLLNHQAGINFTINH